jgi:hypothetical protein
MRNLRHCSQYSDWAVGWRIWGLNASRVKRLLSSSKCPDWSQGPPSLLFNWYWGSFPAVRQPWCEVTTRFHLMLRLRVSGTVPFFLLICFHGKVSILFLRLFTRRLVFPDYESPPVEFTFNLGIFAMLT